MKKYRLASNKLNIWAGLKANQSDTFTPMPENRTQLQVRPLIGQKYSPSQGITE